MTQLYRPSPESGMGLMKIDFSIYLTTGPVRLSRKINPKKLHEGYPASLGGIARIPLLLARVLLFLH